MNRIEKSAVEVQKKCGELAGMLKDQQWPSLDKKGFELAAGNALGNLKQIQKDLSQLEKFLAFETMETEKDVKQKNSELVGLVKLLQKNMELEQKKSTSKLADFDFLPEDKKYNENFSALQHQTATTLLQTNYAMEKLLLESKKDDFAPTNEKSTSKSLIELLKTREDEIQALKKNYSQARRDSLMGSAAIEGVADIEADLQQTNQKIAVHQHRLEESLKYHGQNTEKMFQSAGQLRNETSALQQLLWNHFQKSQELVTQLKKERDFARQLALDTEMETLGLRSQYSHELLGLQEKIAHARNQHKREFEVRLEKLEKELDHKSQMVAHFRETASNQSKTIHALEEKNKHYRLLFDTREKHEKIKKHLKSKKRLE
ncbi:hypothetical protein KKE06_03695 [Candidatus Micrarchaeota archaeon]|nr:hypothetical protein [Candidatus Micrarchaeota archaeon]MBU1930438.1 hypothetical protein [Candidatus Micrarchaeota archaeon]